MQNLEKTTFTYSTTPARLNFFFENCNVKLIFKKAH